MASLLLATSGAAPPLEPPSVVHMQSCTDVGWASAIRTIGMRDEHSSASPGRSHTPGRQRSGAPSAGAATDAIVRAANQAATAVLSAKITQVVTAPTGDNPPTPAPQACRRLNYRSCA
jgi:hypothetical protein